MAGPIVVSSVILPANSETFLLKDSKTLTVAQRNQAYKWIIKNCQYSFGILNHRVIDQKNIYQTTLLAMKRSVLQLFATTQKLPSLILVDAMPLSLANTTYKNIDIHHFPFGESVSSSIAAASIVAKVKRDEIMKKMDEIFPGYAFAIHKGYQTQKHIDALDVKGPSIIHRQTYLKKYFIKTQEKAHENQQLMFF